MNSQRVPCAARTQARAAGKPVSGHGHGPARFARDVISPGPCIGRAGCGVPVDNDGGPRDHPRRPKQTVKPMRSGFPGTEPLARCPVDFERGLPQARACPRCVLRVHDSMPGSPRPRRLIRLSSAALELRPSSMPWMKLLMLAMCSNQSPLLFRSHPACLPHTYWILSPCHVVSSCPGVRQPDRSESRLPIGAGSS